LKAAVRSAKLAATGRGTNMHKLRLLCAAATAWLAAAAPAQTGGWSPDPWLADLAQMRAAFAEKYANLDWLTGERELDLDAAFDRATARIRQARDDGGARAVFDRLVQRLGDGHVAIEWPAAPTLPSPGGAAGPPPEPAGPAGLCRRLGYDARQASAGIGPSLPGYRQVEAGQMFATGIVPEGRERIGLLRIGVFQPQGGPAWCGAAIAALAIDPERPCDDECADRILTWSYRRMTGELEQRIARLRREGATVLLVDVGGNGGGSEWAEAAARIVSPVPLTAERLAFMRGPHWVRQWQRLAAMLREEAGAAAPAERARLLRWADEADAARRQAEPCAAGAACPRLGRAGYATGLVGAAPAGTLSGRPWSPYIFSPAQYPYHDHVWTGPLLVLVDQETWSAAEEFAAELQDNRAAIVLGARSGGAGCGHTDGGTPTILTHSGAILQLPDCVRLRADGSNEVRGIVPDVTVGLRASDGNRLKAQLLSAALPAAVARARALHAGPRRRR
jgi:hypothetical protein